jgi:signal peptidase I
MLFLLVAILGLLLLVTLFVSAFLLWLSSKICRVRRGAPPVPEGTTAPRAGITFRRALGVVLLFSICSDLLAVAFWLARPGQPNDFSAFDILALVASLCLLFFFMRTLVAPTLGRAICVGLLWQVFSAIYVVLFVLVVGTALIRAYVMPTGSMAETLLGYHKDVTCPACGHGFVVNCSAEVDPSEGRPMPTFACICPNCRQRIHFPSAPRHYLLNNKDSVAIADPGLQGGDRIAVGRGLLGSDLLVPRRFNLVVHEYPIQRSLIYVKRLVGLPGETLAIRGGELYVLAADKRIKYDAADAEQDVQDPSQAKELMHIDDAEAIQRFKQGQFEILRKSPEQILSLRRHVYDNDHPAPSQLPRWKGEEGWSASGNGFRSASDSAKHVAWLRYHHFLPDFPEKPVLITDMLGYNTYQNGSGGVIMHTPLLGDNWVGDLLLECEAIIDNPQGELTLELSRGLDRFRAQWELSTGTCTLSRKTKDGDQKLDSRTTAVKKGAYRLRFANVDQRLVVWVDDELPFGNGVFYAPPKDLGPRPENDFEPASIGIRGASVAIQKLKLFRDTYYTVGGIKQGLPHDADVRDFDPLDAVRGRWEDLRDPPFATLYVQPGHYFVLGDNSPESSDSRSWGAVPHRLLLGRAFFVYYPWKRVGPLH